LLGRLRRSQEGAPSARMIVVGLGNPGERYERTRHNAGAMVLDELLTRTGSRLKRHRGGCLVAEVRLGGAAGVLARPLTAMNDSGRPLREVARWYKTPLERLLVVHDELDIPFGQVRVKWAGGTAGHNGLASIVAHFGGSEFGRVRIGISRPPGRRDPVDWVLTPFSSFERKELPWIIGRAADAVERTLADGLEAAMNEFNAPA
jgi:peptidyl-tRNA hydrolase, PTH1 family